MEELYYNPSNGSFLTQDTYRGEQTNPMTWQLYAYCAGNPINYVDPSGHNAKKIKITSSKKFSASNKLINFIKDYESFRSKPYYASEKERIKKSQTIGYGHVILKGESFSSVTKAEATNLLKKDLKSRVATVNRLLKNYSVNQHQFDALVDFEYTTGGLAVSDLLKHVKKNAKLKTIKKDFRSWCRMGTSYYKGLWARRNDEFQMYKKGDYKRNKNGEKSAPKNFI